MGRRISLSSSVPTNNIQPAFGVIGLGRMAQALVVPLLSKGQLDPNQLLAVVGSEATALLRRTEPVSYTHLTLPTIYSV